IEPTHSKTGKELIKHNRYTFVFDKLVKNRTLKAWGCELSHDCKARIRTDLNNNEETKCPPTIHSDNMVNAYEINFDYQSNEYNCQFIPDEQTIVDNYVYVLDNYQIHVDQKMREIFDEENAVEILEGIKILSNFDEKL
uniref:FLYWCH-type domain-containing protein n=1 Tax=Meloidogyne floridensis TaxID=298350 RepID=A0A915NJL0_9BILA